MKFLSRSFVFTPFRLIEKRKEIEKVMEEKEELIAKKLAPWSLVKLLKRIEALSSDKEEVNRFARKLTRRHVILLSEEFHQIEQTIQSKVLTVLIATNSNDVFRVFWKHFLVSPRNSQNHYALRMLFHSNVEYLNYYSSDAVSIYKKVFISEEPFTTLSRVFVRVSKPMLETMEAWRIKLETPIRRMLVDEVWTLGEEQTFLKESPTMIISEFGQMHTTQMAVIVNRYLSVLPYDRFQLKVIEKLIIDRGQPDRDQSGWRDIHESNIEKVKLWLKLKELIEFFDGDNERFIFWKDYVPETEKFLQFRSLKILILYYNQCVVVVFGDVGNATYIYRRDIFDGNFGKQVEGKLIRNVTQLKDRSINIERIIYHGNWQGKGHYVMRRLLGTRR